MRIGLIRCSLALLLLDAHALAHSQSVLLSGFESGLAGWSTLGDVSVQTAAVGLAPTQGTGFAFVTTLGSGEIPYSGTPSPNDSATREFLGLPGGIPQFMAQMPAVDPVGPGGAILEPPIVGEGGAMTYRFYASQAGAIAFDWDRIGRDADSAFLSLWSDDGSIRTNDWIYYAGSFTGTFAPSGVDLCPHQTNTSCADPSQVAFYDAETGWSQMSVDVPQAGWYTIGFGVGEIAEGTAPTVLALDNLTFTPSPVPEPASATLMLLGIAAAAAARSARRQVSGTRA
jgi:hypothetical protein